MDNNGATVKWCEFCMKNTPHDFKHADGVTATICRNCTERIVQELLGGDW